MSEYAPNTNGVYEHVHNRALRALDVIYHRKRDPRRMTDDELLAVRNVGPSVLRRIRWMIAEGHPAIAPFDERIHAALDRDLV